MTAKLPKEHQLVMVDSTHADRGSVGSVRLQCVMRVQDTIFNHNMDYAFLNPTCIVMPGTLTADQINEMHVTDLEKGDTFEMEDEGLSAAPTQPARTEESEDGGAGQVGTFKDELTEILESLKKPLETIPEQPTRQLRKRDRKLRQHYLEWTNGVQIPLRAEIDSLKDQQLGRCLAHH
eukprot:318171-Rhodomonas_salina.1